MLNTRCAKIFLLFDSDSHIFSSFLFLFGHYHKFIRPQLFLIQYLRYRSFISIFLEDEKARYKEAKQISLPLHVFMRKKKRKNNTLKSLVSVKYVLSTTKYIIMCCVFFFFKNLWRRFPEILLYYVNITNKTHK